MTTILKDEMIQDNFLTNGFHLLNNIPSQILKDCENLLNNNFRDLNQGMFVSHYESDLETNLRVSNSLNQIFSDWFEKTFIDYEFVLGHFVIKTNKDSKEFKLHQDWSVVDEEKHPFIHIWVPLQNTNIENGGLYVLPKSHLFFNNYRSGSLGIPFVDIDEELCKFIKNVEIQKGDAFLYHPALFHGSTPNKSSESRRAILLTIRPKKANLEYYHLNKEHKIDIYSIDSKELLSNLKQLTLSEEPANYTNLIKTDKVNIIESDTIDNELLLKCINSN